MPLFSKKPFIVTVHDVIAQEMRKSRLWSKIYFEIIQPFALRKARKIITPSQYSKNKIMSRMKIPAEKIQVIPNGISESYKVLSNTGIIERTMGKCNIQKPYILNVGGESHWKNISRLLESYSLLVQKYNIKEKLVITGIRKQAILEKYNSEIAQLNLSDRIRMLGYIPKEDLVALYNGAEVFVYPSLMEGFGFPPLEAMACGTAVACSSFASMPEVVGGAALLFDPTNTIDMSEKIYCLLTNQKLKHELVNKGLKKIKQYSWEITAKETLKAFKSVTAKRILYYETGSGYGGSSKALRTILSSINRDEIKPYVVLKNSGPHLKMSEDIKPLTLINYYRPKKMKNPFYLLYFIAMNIYEAIRLCIYIKKNEIDIVHINVNLMSGLPAAIASRIMRVSCICHLRQTRRLIKREKIFAPWISKFIALNKKAFDIYRQDIPEEKLVLIYDGINLDEFSHVRHNSFRREMNLNSSPIIGMVGRIVRGKGQKEFILAAKKVLKTKPNTKFVIIGNSSGESDSYYKEVQELLKKEDMKKKIVFTGWRDDVINVISDLDILVLPSTTFPEGLPNVIIEAMALSRPVIATDIPGPSDIVENGKTGFLVPPGDIQVMAGRILQLLDDQALGVSMGKAGRRRVEELFDIKDKVKEIKRVYEKVMTSKKRMGKVSILIPTRYDSRYIIELALKSIKRNTHYPDYEIIVCDCGVNEDTKTFLEDWARSEKIKIITAANPVSPDDDLVNAVSSDCFVLMHDDIQILRRGWLTRRMRIMAKDKNNAIIGVVVNNYSKGKRFFTLGLLVKTDVSRKLGLKWSKQNDNGLDTGGFAYQKFFAQSEFKFVAYKPSRDIRHFAKMSWPIRKVNDGQNSEAIQNVLKKREEKLESIRAVLEKGIY